MTTDAPAPLPPVDPLDALRSGMADNGRKAKILTISTDLTIGLMREVLPFAEVTMRAVMLAGEFHNIPADRVNILMSTALSIAGNMASMLGEILAETSPELQRKFLDVLPQVMEGPKNGQRAGDVSIMNAEGQQVDGELRGELEEVFREKYKGGNGA